MKNLNPHNFLLYACLTFVGVLFITIPSFASLTPQYVFAEQPITRHMQKKQTRELTPEQVKTQIQIKMQQGRGQFQEETFGERKEAMTKMLVTEQELLTQAQTALNTDKPVHALTPETKDTLTKTIVDLQTQVSEMQKALDAATTVDELYAIHAQMISWLYTNKAALKDLGINMYTETLRSVVNADVSAVAAAHAALVIDTMKGFDTTSFSQSIAVADASVKAADTAVQTAETNPTFGTVVPATDAAITATMDVSTMLEEQEKVGQ